MWFYILFVCFIISYIVLFYIIRKQDPILRAFFNIYYGLGGWIIIIYIRQLVNNSENISILTFFGAIGLIFMVRGIMHFIVNAKKSYFNILAIGISIIFIMIVLFYSNLYNAYRSQLTPTPLSHISLIYYSIATFTTVGYGDIRPIASSGGDTVKVIASSEMIVGYLFSAILIALFISKFIELSNKNKA